MKNYCINYTADGEGHKAGDVDYTKFVYGAGTVSGAKREDVAKFSFLMSIPIILGSVVMELKDVVFPQEGTSLSLGGPEIVGMIIGVVCAAVFGFLSVKWMLKVIGKANYKWFAFYLVLLSMTCFWLNALAIL